MLDPDPTPDAEADSLAAIGEATTDTSAEADAAHLKPDDAATANTADPP
jgi:hypothetical protein